MGAVYHILLYKLKVFLKLSTTWNAAHVIKSAASIIVFGGFAVGAYLFSRAAAAYVLEEIRLGSFLLHRFLGMLLYVFFLSVNVGNIIVSYASFYRSKEMSYLLTKPVSFTSLFVVKFLDNFFSSSLTLFMMAIAVLAGYGSYFHMSWTFYFWAMFGLFIPFMLLSAALAVMSLLVLMLAAAKFGARIVMAGVVAGYIGVIYLYFEVTNPMGLVTSVMKYFPRVNLYYGFLDPPLAKYLPSHWVAETLYWTMRGEHALAFSYMAILLVVCATALVAMVLFGKAALYRTWLASLEMRANEQQSRKTSTRLMAFTRKPILSPQTSALVKKEFWQFFREPSQWIHLAIMAVLVIVFVGSVSGLDFALRDPFLSAISYLVLFVFNAFLLSSIALRFVYPLISTEGQNIWIIRAAPLSVGSLYRIKFLIAFIPLIVLGQVLVLASHQGLAHYPFLLRISGLTSFLVSLVMVSLHLGAGALFSDFKEPNPIRVASSQGATLTFLASIVFMVFLVAALFFPIQHFFSSVLKGHLFDASLFYQSFLVVSVICIVISSLSSWLGLRSMRRDI